jgi:hypothetical protein
MPSPLADVLAMQQPIMPASKATIAPTDVLGAYQMSTNQANQQYLAKLNQQNSLWGGLAGLGGSALSASILKGSLFGGAKAAAPAATPLASGSALPDLGNLAFDSSGAPTGIYGVGPLASAADAGATGAATGAAGAGAAGATSDAAFDAGTSAVPWLTAGGDAAATGVADAGTVAGADAAATAAPAVADAGFTLADILPFLFA